MIVRVMLIVFGFFAFEASAAKMVKSLPSIFDNVGVVSESDVVDLVRDKLLNYDLDENLKIDIRGFDSGFSLRQKREEYQVSIEDFSIKKKSRRFKAKIAFLANDFYEIVEVNGRYSEMVNIPVLASRVSHNTLITIADIDYMDIEKHKMRSGTIINENDLVGQVLKHSMQPMRAVRKRDVVREQVVSRNSTVSLIYKTPFMTLKSFGIVMDSGAKGDVVRVRNGTSNKIVQAVIKDANSAVVAQETL